MARKKIVLVIVEGPSDDTALGVTLKQVYDKDMVYLHIMHRDITTQKHVNSQNIIAKMGNEVRAYAKSRHYTAKDFKQIIHIVDTDGVYLSDDMIIEDKNSTKVFYEDNGIHTADVQGIIARNQQKRDNLYRLRSCGTIWNIPYRVYYMSCNLDHVLYDKRNSSDEEKENDAYQFAEKYKGHLEEFIDFICNSQFSVKGSYKDSWDCIEDGMNSIERHTNLSVCIEEEKRCDQ